MKLALCVNSADLPSAWQAVGDTPTTLPIHPDFWGINTFLVDRAICETDPSTQQLLPYNVLVDENDRVFVYSRGKGGAEARLRGKLSIGVGGHVDGDVPPGFTLKGWLRVEAAREIEEEVRLKVFDAGVNFEHFLVDRSNPDGEKHPVGLVHLGLLSANRVHSADVHAVAAENIEGASWMTINGVLAPEVYGRLEPWSRLAIGVLAGLRSVATVAEAA